MLETYISKKVFYENYEDGRESVGGIESDEVVMILNPTQYTVKDDDADILEE